MYSDDITLLAVNRQCLQRIMKELALEVNLKNSSVIV